LGEPAGTVVRAKTPDDRRAIRLSFANCKVGEVAIKMLPDVPKLMLPAVLNRSANANLTTANAQNHIGPAIDAKLCQRIPSLSTACRFS